MVHRLGVRRGAAAVLLTSAMVISACSGGDGADSTSTTSTTSAVPTATPMGAADLEVLRELVGDGACDELDPTHCLLPFPSNRFVVDDPSSDTGKRVSLPEGQLANTAGATLDPMEWNRNDGFSPNTPILFFAPDVDLDASGVATIGDIGDSMQDGSPVAVVDLDSGERIPHWVEIDSHGAEDQRVVIIRPAVALDEGAHVGVIIGQLVDHSGQPIEASLATRAYRDNLTTDIDAVEDRRGGIDEVYAAADRLGYDRATMFAAWDFTVASQRSLSERMLHIRDDGFERLGDAAPNFEVTNVVTTDLKPGIGRVVEGTFDVPLYLDGDGAAGSRFTAREGDELPEYAGSDYRAEFACQIPEAAIAGSGATARPVVYGHGLLGSLSEVKGSQVAKNASMNNMMYCATNWIGMSSDDVGNAVEILGNISKFASLADRSQQGILNTLFLARVMGHAGGFSSDAAFANTAGASVIDTSEVYFDGNSQGGIMGGAATAVSTEWAKAVLGVPGMNYSLLLSRSVDFDTYFAVLRGAYPNELDQAILYPVLQMLWDRAESAGYAQHMTDDPYEGTPEHQVLLHVGFGDHQVAQVAAEVMARTIGAGVREPALAEGRHPDAMPFFGLDMIPDAATERSLLVYWDSGTLPPPAANITPVSSDLWQSTCGAMAEEEWEHDARCADSHEDPRRAPAAIQQKDAFFRPDGKITDTCDGRPCVAPNRFSLDY